LFGLHFQIHKKLNHDILGWLNKYKALRHCGFPLANPQFDQSIDFLSQIYSIFWICYIFVKITLNLSVHFRNNPENLLCLTVADRLYSLKF
jgi:hypothetical protein